MTQILSHVLGHEGENSLLSYLIAQDYATELGSYCDHEMGAFSYFATSITLTEKGMQMMQGLNDEASKTSKV